jgi:predicted ribosomally synthesized peptide with nif11-like leader
MSLEDVKRFYAHLAVDEKFRAQIKSVKNKKECSQIVKSAGYDFTEVEFEEYTSSILDLTDDELFDLDEKELEAVYGGAAKVISDPIFFPLYGIPIDPHPQPVPPGGGHYPTPRPRPHPRPWPGKPPFPHPRPFPKPYLDEH